MFVGTYPYRLTVSFVPKFVFLEDGNFRQNKKYSNLKTFFESLIF